ncbi:hypothetical protein MMC21_004769 [Puttea exsequens]|nr:hypothetical protein [Puttea exsequens]
MSSNDVPASDAGAALYSRPLILSLIYDWFVLGLSNAYIWRCPTSSVQVPFFKKHRTTNHLDIGVGTGYYLSHAEFPKVSSVTLCDLNPDTLTMARKQIPNLQTEIICHDVFKPLPTFTQYSSISLMFLLHCLPGPPARKAAIFEHLKKNLTDDGVLFGSTILGKGVEHNAAGRFLMRSYNRKGVFGNVDDGAGVFLEALKENFQDVEARVEGVVLVFDARGPRR